MILAHRELRCALRPSASKAYVFGTSLANRIRLRVAKGFRSALMELLGLSPSNRVNLKYYEKMYTQRKKTLQEL